MIASLLRLLGSNREGERLGSVNALDRKLKGDFHALADLVEQTNGGKLNDAEMKKSFDAGYEAGHADGVRAAEAKIPHDADGFCHVNGSKSWREIANFCQQRGAHLRSGKEREL